MVYHVLKDGSTPADITGKVVKVTDAKNLYELLSAMSERLTNEKQVKQR